MTRATLHRHQRTCKEDNPLYPLINNARNESVRFCEIAQAFKRKIAVQEKNRRTKDVICPGILPLLREFFWPDYTYTRDKHNEGTGVSNSREGINRGKLVHSQLQDYINCSFKTFKIKHEEIHEYTAKAIFAMEDWKIKPGVAEFIIYDDNNFGSAVDHAFLTDENEIGIMDWKNGFDDYFLQGSGSMKGPLQGIYSNCPMNQGFLQLLLEKIILERFYGIKVKHVYVIQITRKGVYPFSLPEKMLGLQESIYYYFLSQLEEKRKKAREKRTKKRTKKDNSSPPNKKKKKT